MTRRLAAEEGDFVCEIRRRLRSTERASEGIAIYSRPSGGVTASGSPQTPSDQITAVHTRSNHQRSSSCLGWKPEAGKLAQVNQQAAAAQLADGPSKSLCPRRFPRSSCLHRKAATGAAVSPRPPISARPASSPPPSSISCPHPLAVRCPLSRAPPLAAFRCRHIPGCSPAPTRKRLLLAVSASRRRG